MFRGRYPFPLGEEVGEHRGSQSRGSVSRAACREAGKHMHLGGGDPEQVWVVQERHREGWDWSHWGQTSKGPYAPDV